MAKKHKCTNPKIAKFNSSVIRDKQPIAKRALAARKKGTIKGLVPKMRGR